jgi:hypothetical protein
MKDFVILVYNVHMVNPSDVDKIAVDIETNTGCRVYQMGHIDRKCVPFYVTSPFVKQEAIRES